MSTIAERIAALKLQQIGEIPLGSPTTHPKTSNTGPPPVPAPRARPPPPARPIPASQPDRAQTASVPPGHDGHRPAIGNRPDGPPLPARPPLPNRPTQSTTSERPSPALPPRRPSAAPSSKDLDVRRRGSTDSQSSIATTKSSVSAISTPASIISQADRNRIRAPEFNASALPALPPKRTQEEKEAAERKYGVIRPTNQLRPSRSTPKIAQTQDGTTPPPPPLPTRTSNSTQNGSSSSRPEVLPPPKARPSALTMGFDSGRSSNGRPPLPGARPTTSTSTVPPPIPTNSRPDLSALMASKPKIDASPVPAASAPAGPIAITSFPQFNQILSSHRIVVSDFYADWCGPCREFAPTYEQLSKEYSRPGQISFVKINTDHNPDVRDHHKIAAWPTLIIFENGTQVEKFEGAWEYGITSTVEKLAKQAGINLSAPISSAPAVAAPIVPTPPQNGTSAPGCLICRDFSGPDNHAARFPRESLPSQDVGWLATQLTAPFPSLTDKARVIFTWLHHNVAYDTVAFFNNNVQPSTPQSTLATGLAVCEGYAALFAAMAVKVGLEAVVVGGASKGFGHTQIAPGAPIPVFKTDHAWNAVKIDHGEWKLLDSCWGAGSVDRDKGYTKGFKPERFTQSNNEFGLDHFPEDGSMQFRTDGRRVSWEEFVRGAKDGSGCEMFGMVAEEGFLKTSFQPLNNPIVVAQQFGPSVRFAFQRVCAHWDPIKNGQGPHYFYVLILEMMQGGKKGENMHEFETNGEVWWCDVPTSSLRPGTQAKVMALTQFDGRDGRGLTKQEFLRRKGRCGWAGGFLCLWDLQ